MSEVNAGGLGNNMGHQGSIWAGHVQANSLPYVLPLWSSLFILNQYRCHYLALPEFSESLSFSFLCCWCEEYYKQFLINFALPSHLPPHPPKKNQAFIYISLIILSCSTVFISKLCSPTYTVTLPGSLIGTHSTFL